MEVRRIFGISGSLLPPLSTQLIQYIFCSTQNNANRLFCFRHFSFQETQSTWVNAWRKMRTLLPFLWPKKSLALQFRVCFCIGLLIGGRFINVLVPIYNQKIGKITNFLVQFHTQKMSQYKTYSIF